MSNLKKNGQLRWSPSYLRRRGQMTPAQKRALRDHWHTYGIEFSHGHTLGIEDLSDSCERPIHLEIGFGMGENLIHQASIFPDRLILGIEVHKPGIAAAIKKAVDLGIDNIRVMRGDARLILSDYFAWQISFTRVSILFPDPWPNKENAHRRIVQTALLELLEARMMCGGELHIATDVESYAIHSYAVMNNRLNWLQVDDFELPSLRCSTKYEQKGIDNGRMISDLLYRYKG